MKDKTVLCYGDSNTWGYIPGDKGRYDSSTRWPCVLQNGLGKSYSVFEEGLNGRTTVFDDPKDSMRNGKTFLQSIVQKYTPLDLVIIMLGTNDLKSDFDASPLDICRGLECLVNIVINEHTSLNHAIPELLIICPPKFADMTNSPFSDSFIGGQEKSNILGKEIMNYFANNDIHILDASDFITSSLVDGIHLEPEEQIKLGKAVTLKVKNIFN